MNHSAHRRHRPRKAPPQRGPYGLNKNGSNLREGYSQRGRHNFGGHNGLGDRIQGRLPATELPANGQTTLPHNSGPSHNSGPKLDGADNAATPFQTVQLQPLPEQEHRQLENLILQRIQTRLPGRVRNLAVRITDDSVELTGECRTYYTKQMAQHVAMGVLDYQQLVNSINVAC